MPTYNTITLEFNGNKKEGNVQTAAAGFFPGMIARLYDDNKVGVLGTNGAVPVVMVLVEQDKIGKGVNDAYAAGNWANLVVPASGDIVTMRVGSAATDIAAGDLVTADETGYLTTVTLDATIVDTAVMGVAQEASDTSGGDDLIKVMVR